MTYGEAVRDCRTDRGWSRAQMEIIITARFRAVNFRLSADGIKLIEYGRRDPRETTRKILGQLFPDLCTKVSHSESVEGVSVTA